MTTPEVSTRKKPRVEKTVDLTKLANENEAIVVRNNLSTISVFVYRNNGQDEICEFGPKGDPKGEDVMELPSTYLKNAQFRKQLQRKIYEIIEADNPEVLAALERSQAAWDAQQSAKDENDMLIERNQPQAFSGAQCIAQEGRGTCTNFAIKANLSERPPLCTTHSYLASQYTPEETGRFTDGKPEVHWVKIQYVGR